MGKYCLWILLALTDIEDLLLVDSCKGRLRLWSVLSCHWKWQDDGTWLASFHLVTVTGAVNLPIFQQPSSKVSNRITSFFWESTSWTESSKADVFFFLHAYSRCYYMGLSENWETPFHPLVIVIIINYYHLLSLLRLLGVLSFIIPIIISAVFSYIQSLSFIIIYSH